MLEGGEDEGDEGAEGWKILYCLYADSDQRRAPLL